MEYSSGLMDECMTASGNKAKCMGKGRYKDTFGRIVTGIWANSHFVKA
jgi:hypothetical protein